MGKKYFEEIKMTHELLSNYGTLSLHGNVSLSDKSCPFTFQTVLRHQPAFLLITTHFLLFKITGDVGACSCTCAIPGWKKKNPIAAL